MEMYVAVPPSTSRVSSGLHRIEHPPCLSIVQQDDIRHCGMLFCAVDGFSNDMFSEPGA